MSSVFGAGANRGAQTVGRPQDLYPSPFFDVSNNYMPRSLKETFDWCSYYQMTNPLISAVVNKLATYPVTDLVYETSNPGELALYKSIFEDTLQFRQAVVEHNLNRYTFGTCVNTIAFPFRKVVKCAACTQETAVESVRRSWRNFKFFFECPKCQHTGLGESRDEPVRTTKGIRIMRWNLQSIDIDYNELTGQYRYFYKMPTSVKNDITLGRPGVIEFTPQAFIDAVANKKSIMLPADKVFHARRAAVSRDPSDSGWGAPIILPVLKDVFLLQILRKAQEAVALEHVVPMRVMFPQITTDAGNVYAQVNLQDWQREVEGQVTKWRKDPNHIPVMPVPIGYQMIGGQGRNLMLHQEMRAYNEIILGGMGVATGFFYGESMFSGASVNMRALENEFLGNIEDMTRFATFVRDRVVSFLGIPSVSVKFKPFKMADDIQRASFDMQLNQMGKLSTRTLLESRNHNYDAEMRLLDDEAKANNQRQRVQSVAGAEAQGEAMVIQARYQAQAQQFMQAQAQPQPGQPQPGQPQQEQPQQVPPGQEQQMPQQGQEQAPQGQEQAQSPLVDLYAQANTLTRQLQAMNETDRYQALARLRAANPDLYTVVNERMSGSGPTPAPGRRGTPNGART